jgi:acyl-CoA thioester hydrolase
MNIPRGTFAHRRRVAFADTDAMGVVHHVNYLRYFEEARVAWLREKGLSHLHYPQADMCLAVLRSSCDHFQSVRFEDEILVYVEARAERLKIHMQYAIVRAQDERQSVAAGYTLLVPVNSRLKLVRPPAELAAVLEKGTWTETWL